ncbi:MAG: ATP-binding cassette domain-containing protein [Flammeovirgaceae bacterium]|jgi:ABC-type multidrug transport system ATPase subunit|nr:ATP-binding cassette domain-containing protein [Flammeovirgaceae bacterium]
MQVAQPLGRVNTKNLGKRFRQEWIFRDFNFEFSSGKRYAITGPNGSGKSTLMQLLWGQTLPSEGNTAYFVNNKPLPQENVYQEVAIVTPYLELIDEFTLKELLRFHFSLQKPIAELTIQEMMELMELTHVAQKAVGFFSSGMKQRLKLALAVLTRHTFLFLDEPYTNLDEPSCQWAQNLLETYPSAITWIASNDKKEYENVDEIINLKNYKR